MSNLVHSLILSIAMLAVDAPEKLIETGNVAEIQLRSNLANNAFFNGKLTNRESFELLQAAWAARSREIRRQWYPPDRDVPSCVLTIVAKDGSSDTLRFDNS